MNPPGAGVATPEAAGSPTPEAARAGRPGRRRAIRIALFALGLAALAGIVAAVGWKSVAANLSQIGLWFFGLVFLYALAQLAFATGWWILTGPGPRPFSFAELFAAYLGGDAINYFTTVGGEPVKARLLSEHMRFSRAFATVAVHRHADVLAQWIFLIIGVGVALTRFSLPAAARLAAVGGLVLLGGLLLWLTRGLRRGAFRPLLTRLGRFGPLRERMARLDHSAAHLDERIREFYSGGGAPFWAAVGWCFLGWCGGLLETYLILRLIAPGEGWAAAFAIESLAMILNTVLLFIPARIGSAEGIRAGVTMLVGLTAAQGLAYGLARRARELLWVVPGIVVLLKHHLLGAGRLELSEAGIAEEARR